VPIEILIGACSTIIASLVAVLGSRFVAKSSRAVGEQQVALEGRRVSLAEFEAFVARYEKEREELRTELREEQALLRVALRYIATLWRQMRALEVTPADVPDDLKEVPWELYN
jgi:hypothetical protein